jgi:DUF4097 and DUF4098 domain-containing protein YvlB
MTRFQPILCLLCLIVATGAYGDQTIDESKAAHSEGTVSIENIAGSIVVIGWNKNEVKVTGTLGKNIEGLTFEVDGDETEIEVDYPKHGKNTGDADLEIHVPERSSVDIETVSASIDVSKVKGALDLQSVSGRIDVTGEPSEVEIQSVSGTAIAQVSTSEISAENVSGSIELSGKVTRIEAATVSGNIEIMTENTERIETESVSGSIEYDGALAKNGSYTFDSFSGTTKLTLPGNTNADVDFETFSGSVDNEFNGKGGSKSQSFAIGSGGASVSVETFSGTLRIRKK